jgi:DNA-binding NarL/FixJ family response regulator
MVLEGIRSLLINEKDVRFDGYAMNGQACLEYFIRNTADVILMDINLPDMSGLDLCREIRTRYPGIRVLGLSTFNQGSFINRMMEYGASGYILKNAGRQELLHAIREVHAGRTYLSEEAGRTLEQTKEQQANIPALTRREKEVLELIAGGLTNPEIAGKLFVSSSTVDSHRKNLLAKLNAKNTASLIRYAIENKLLNE